MINAYSDLIAYDGSEWDDYLTKICLIDIFQDLIPLLKDKTALTQCIRFIVWTYSKDSECIILGTDWLGNKRRIFEKSMLPKEYYEDTVLLQNRIIVKVIQRWIDFQDSETTAQLLSLKDLMVEMRLSSNSRIVKSSGEIDFDQKFKNAGYVKELRIMIDDLEQELIQASPKLKEAAREVANSKNKNTIGVETFAN